MHIHYVALNSAHGSDFIEEKSCGLVDLLFLYVKSPSTFIIGDNIHTITTPCALLINSYTPYKYFPNKSEYIDDYLHFAVDNQASLLNELTFPLNTPIPIVNDNSINAILLNIVSEHKPYNKYANRILELLVKLLLLKVEEQWDLQKQENDTLPHYKDLLEIRSQIQNNPEKNWTIEELADQAHLSHAYFQVMYKKAFGVTCITDVIHTKITSAKVLLSSTNLSVGQVSQELGYNEVYHFIRQFKKHTGLTPGAFRKKTI